MENIARTLQQINDKAIADYFSLEKTEEEVYAIKNTLCEVSTLLEIAPPIWDPLLVRIEVFANHFQLEGKYIRQARYKYDGYNSNVYQVVRDDSHNRLVLINVANPRDKMEFLETNWWLEIVSEKVTKPNQGE